MGRILVAISPRHLARLEVVQFNPHTIHYLPDYRQSLEYYVISKYLGSFNCTASDMLRPRIRSKAKILNGSHDTWMILG